MKIGKNETNITSSNPHKMAAPKIVGAATIAAKTGRDFFSGNCGSSILIVIRGIIAKKERAEITTKGNHPSIPVSDITIGPIAKPITKTVLYIVTILPLLLSSAIESIQVSNAFHARAPANPIKNLIINHAVKLSNKGNVKYKRIVNICAITIDRANPIL